MGVLPRVSFLLLMLISVLVSPIQKMPDSSGLIITDFQVSTTNIQLGETFTLSGKVANVGSYSAFHISPVTFFKNISIKDFWFPQEIPSETRRIAELKPGEVWNFTLTLRAVSVATFDIGVSVVYAKSPEYGSVGTEVKSRTVGIEVTRAPLQIPSWLNWWTVVALTALAAALGWRLNWLRKLRGTWKTLVVMFSAMVIIGLMIYMVVLDTRWTPAMILGLPLAVILLGFVSKKALVSILAPVISTVAVTSAVEMLHLLSHYYPPGGLVSSLTALALLTSPLGSGIALRRQGKDEGTILLACGLFIWFFFWLNALMSG